MDPYLFTTPRLGFRNWRADDLDAFHTITGDARVMEFFPATLDRAETALLIARFLEHYHQHGYTYYAVETRDDGRLAGFIGLMRQHYLMDPAEFTDVGWRLHPRAWGHGLATEGARACLDHAATALGLTEIYATAPAANVRSLRVMEKLGMRHYRDFVHPKLAPDDRLQPISLYRTFIGK